MSEGVMVTSILRRNGRFQWHLIEAGVTLASGWATCKRAAKSCANAKRLEIYRRSK